MKRITILFFLLLSTPLFSDDLVLHQGKCFQYNEFTEELNESDFSIVLADGIDEYSLDFSTFMERGLINIADLNQFREVLNKYQEWNKLAKQKEVEIEKEIKQSSFL